ncbi:hypothetical protein [Bradyrhizobium sp. SZCCHNRI1002]|uniref:Pam3-gp28 family putative phage holin n=1 Tax=Bradyrhizobium sp. SZCCHNRI1002 TaxID=3057274 RepID=UPI0028EE9305|nr:hypothetical protein [Bradyrhizobium sp. SZCCHNRI1002]
MDLIAKLLTSSMFQSYVAKCLASLLRHVATLVAGALLVGDTDGQAKFIGAVMMIGALVWSWWQKRGMRLAIDEYKALMAKGAAVVMLALALAAVAPRASLAADVAPPAAAAPVLQMPSLSVPVPCSMSNCSGWYLGFGMSGNGSNLDIVANGINQSVFSAGGILDVHGGYQFWDGNYFFAVEGGVGNEFAKAQPVAGAVSLNTIVGYELVKVGGALSGLINPSTSTTTPGQAPAAIAVPASLSKIYMSPYFAAGAIQRGGYSQWVTGAGAEFVLAAAWSMDLRYLYAPSSNSLPSTNIITIGLNRHF